MEQPIDPTAAHGHKRDGNPDGELCNQVLVFTVGYVPPDLAEKIFDSGLLAGEAVYLCHRFGLPVPEWTEKPEYLSAGGLEQVLG